jgi:hypothetical protein
MPVLFRRQSCLIAWPADGSTAPATGFFCCGRAEYSPGHSVCLLGRRLSTAPTTVFDWEFTILSKGPGGHFDPIGVDDRAGFILPAGGRNRPSRGDDDNGGSLRPTRLPAVFYGNLSAEEVSESAGFRRPASGDRCISPCSLGSPRRRRQPRPPIRRNATNQSGRAA